MTYLVTIDGVARQVQVSLHPEGGWTVKVDDGEPQHITGGQVGPAEWMLGPHEQPRRDVGLFVEGEQAWAQLDGHAWEARVEDARRAALRAGSGAGAGDIHSPMPGAVVRVLVAADQTVEKGQPIVIVEAMKMENELKAEVDGTVLEVLVEPGQAVDSNALLVRIQPAE